jgi:hypothetical protein
MATPILINVMWVQFRWWIAVEDTKKLVLWIINHPIVVGHHTTALAKSYEEIDTLRIHPHT